MISDVKAFEAKVPELKKILARRRSSWTLTTLDWEDVENILLTHLWQKFHLYDSKKGPIQNWANTVISSQLKNLLRNNLYRWSKPCITASPSGGNCKFNEGGGSCSYTKSGKQCDECPLYARWLKKKAGLYNIKASLPLDYHDQEVQNTKMQDYVDFDSAKKVIDIKIMKQLNSHDAKIYRLLFIDHFSIEEVGKKMRYKKQGSNKVPGYQVIKKLIVKFKAIAKDILEKEGV